MEAIHSQDQKRRQSTRRIARKVVTYVVICAFLAFVNYTTTPDRWWVQWVIAGWGIGVVLSIAFYLLDCEDEKEEKNKE